MAKIIKYNFPSAEINRGTEEEPKIEQVVYPVEIVCRTQAVFDANYPIAEKEAVPGSIAVIGEFDGEQEPTQEERIADLEQALDMLLSGVTQ